MKLIKLLFLQPLTKRILDPLMYLEKHSLHTMDGRCTILDRTVKQGVQQRNKFSEPGNMAGAWTWF